MAGSFYQVPNNPLPFWFDDPTVESVYIPEGAVAITPEEAAAMQAAASAPTWAMRQEQARALLQKSDVVVTRAFEAGLAVTSDWKAARTSWRAVVSASTGDPTVALAAAPTDYA
jgi:hypothetical protein